MGFDMERPNLGMTPLWPLICVLAVFGLAAVVVPGPPPDAALPRTSATLERVCELVRPRRGVLPPGRLWLPGPRALPEGVSAGSAWPLRAWASRDGAAPYAGPIGIDGWGRAVAVLFHESLAGPVALVVSAGADGELQSRANTGLSGDDVGMMIPLPPGS